MCAMKGDLLVWLPSYTLGNPATAVAHWSHQEPGSSLSRRLNVSAIPFWQEGVGAGAAVCPHCFPEDGQWLPANSKEGEAGSTGFLWASLNLNHNWQVIPTVEKALSLLSPSWKCLHRQPRGPLNWFLIRSDWWLIIRITVASFHLVCTSWFFSLYILCFVDYKPLKFNNSFMWLIVMC